MKGSSIADPLNFSHCFHFLYYRSESKISPLGDVNLSHNCYALSRLLHLCSIELQLNLFQ